MQTSRPNLITLAARSLGVVLIVFLNISSFILAILFILEVFVPDYLLTRGTTAVDELIKRSYYSPGVKVDPYRVFEELYPHPLYRFYWKMSRGHVIPRSNEVVSLDQNGFRGTEDLVTKTRNTKPLAFLLGGSAAFGYPASSNDTTITGYLNQIQERFYFINAGVPGFDSTAENMRLSHQIVEFKPELVISYTFFNDIQHALEGQTERTWGFVASLAPKSARLMQVAEHHYPFSIFLKKDKPSQEDLESAIDRQVDIFIDNQKRMLTLSLAKKFHFITVIQPMTQTHDKVTIRGPYQDLFRRGVLRVLASDYCQRYCLNYSGFFDSIFDIVPVAFQHFTIPALDASIDLRDVVFADACHLLDRGNAIVARKLVEDLGLNEPKHRAD
jgi:hypothetical protein